MEKKVIKEYSKFINEQDKLAKIMYFPFRPIFKDGFECGFVSGVLFILSELKKQKSQEGKE